MAATDKFIKVGNPGSATSLAAPGYTVGDGTITVVSTTNWTAGPAGCVFAIDIIGADGLRIDGTYNVYQGTVATATSITNVSHISGTGTNRNYPAGTTTRVYIVVASEIQNRLVDGLIVEHNQDGTHGAVTATSVSTDTITEKTAAAGVTIDGMTIKDNLVVGAAGKGVNNSSLDTTAGEIGGAWIDWTPSLVNISGGTLNYAKYMRVGKTVYFRFKYTLAGAGIAGSPTISLPVNMNAGYATNDFLQCDGQLFDQNLAQRYMARCIAASASTISVLYQGGTAIMGSISSAAPITWAASDQINIVGVYEAA